MTELESYRNRAQKRTCRRLSLGRNRVIRDRRLRSPAKTVPRDSLRSRENNADDLRRGKLLARECSQERNCSAAAAVVEIINTVMLAVRRRLFIGVVRNQIPDPNGVIRPVLRAMEIVKGNAKCKPKGNVKGKACARGTCKLRRDGSSNRLRFGRQLGE